MGGHYLEQVHTCLNYEELIGSKISSFGPCFLSRIDSIEFARKYLNSRFRSETRFQSCFYQNCVHTGKSLSEAFILTSTNPQYDKILFIDLFTSSIHENYMLGTWGEHVVFTNCFLFGLFDI